MLPGVEHDTVAQLEAVGGWQTLPQLLRALAGGKRDATLATLRKELGQQVSQVARQRLV